jgi:hypothetical protein
MCNMAKVSSLSLSLPILLILAVCIFSLATHFLSEGLTPVAENSGVGLTSLDGHAHLVDELCEDNFIFPFQTCLLVEHPTTALQAVLATGERSFSASPLLPPPNS